MNHTKLVSRSIAWLLAILVLAGCAAPAALEASPCPTSASPSCPTCPSPSCPTTPAAAQLSAGETAWNSILQKASAIKIIFDPGDKCSIETNPGFLTSAGLIYYQIQVNDQARGTYAVIFSTFDEGKTLADMQAVPKNAQQAPSWAHSFQENYVMRGSTSYYSMKVSSGPIYISCFTSIPNGLQRILDYGPVEIK